MSEKLLVFLFVGTGAMSIPILALSAQYQINKVKAFLATVFLTVFGTMGTFLMYYVENLRFGGLSFYGAVFLVPVAFLLVAPVLKVSYGKLMDLCAIGECIMLALMKVHCIIGNCCFGRELFVLPDGQPILFPSRIVEMAAALVIFCVLVRWAKVGKNQGQLYAWYLLLYGSSRFILNFFRAAWQDRNGSIPMGTIWSVIAVMIGIIMLWAARRRHQKKEELQCLM